jgi:hypothetical protein
MVHTIYMNLLRKLPPVADTSHDHLDRLMRNKFVECVIDDETIDDVERDKRMAKAEDQPILKRLIRLGTSYGYKMKVTP